MGDLTMSQHPTMQRTCACGTTFTAKLRGLAFLLADAEFERTGYFPEYQENDFCTLCDTCAKVQSDEWEKQQREEEERRRMGEVNQKWRDKCPPIYQTSDLSHPGLSPEALKMVQEWDGLRGLGIVGTTGKGKTRLLCCAIKRGMDAGWFAGFEIISHTAFSGVARRAACGDPKNEDERKLRHLRDVHCLLLDDLGKAPNTERADAELEELIEYRTTHQLPILWTANGSGAWLEARFGPDRGPALLRRLTEFCDCITV